MGNWWVGDNATESYTCTVKEREAVVHRSIAVLLYEYYETLDDVAETGTVSNLGFQIFIAPLLALHHTHSLCLATR